MQCYNSVFLNCDLASSSLNLDNINQEQLNSSSILAKIPILNPPFDIIHYHEDNPSNILISVNNLMLNSLQFWLTTDRNTELTGLINPWNLTLKIEIYEYKN